MNHIVDGNKMHPPVPPEFLFQYLPGSGECELRIELADSDGKGLFFTDSRLSRLCIGALLEVAWQKRAERLQALMTYWMGFKYSTKHDIYRERYYTALDRKREAEANAHAWRVWGEQK